MLIFKPVITKVGSSNIEGQIRNDFHCGFQKEQDDRNLGMDSQFLLNSMQVGTLKKKWMSGRRNCWWAYSLEEKTMEYAVIILFSVEFHSLSQQFTSAITWLCLAQLSLFDRQEFINISDFPPSRMTKILSFEFSRWINAWHQVSIVTIWEKYLNVSSHNLHFHSYWLSGARRTSSIWLSPLHRINRSMNSHFHECN